MAGDEESLGQRALMEQGHQVHVAGRSLFGGAVMVPQHLNLDEAAEETSRMVASGATTLLEAGACGNGLGVRFDVLERGKGGWKIVEIKSGSTVKDAYLDDCAIQFACARAAGMEVESVEVMHPSTSRVRLAGGTGAEVLVREYVTDAVFYRSMGVWDWVEACVKTLEGSMPDVEPGDQCKDPHVCPFASVCGKPVENTDPDLIAYLPSKAGPVKECVDAGMTRLSELPPGAIQTGRNALVREEVLRKRAVVVEEVAKGIACLDYPRHFVDFEAAGFVI
jgi:hypothetical protein